MAISRSSSDPADGAPRGSLAEQMQRGDLLAVNCPSRDVLKHVTSRWGVLVLISLEGGTRRFSELRRGIGGVSERMLAQTLQWLEGDGLVDRVAFEVVPPHVEYSLTPLGREAAERVRALADWIEASLPRIAETWAARGEGAED
jgi:DNA-binding HxlR family transcriptional regulator